MEQSGTLSGLVAVSADRRGRKQPQTPRIKRNEQKLRDWPGCWLLGGSTSAAVCVCWVCLKLLLSRFGFVVLCCCSGEPVRPDGGSNLLRDRFMVTGGYRTICGRCSGRQLAVNAELHFVITVYFVVDSAARRSVWTSRHLVFPRVPFEGAFKSIKAARSLRTLSYMDMIIDYRLLTDFILRSHF